MGEYYLGDPCYVIPDDEWADFCNIMRDDGEDFEYKGETCRVIGTGGDGDFGGLSVDAGIIGVIPVALCDPQALKDYVPSDARLINRFATLEKYGWGDIILVDDDPINGYHCECGWHGCTSIESEYNMASCDTCGSMVASSCVHYTDNGEYCCEECSPEEQCEQCGNDFIPCGGDILCDDCSYYSLCGCPKDDPSDSEDECADCKADDDADDEEE